MESADQIQCLGAIGDTGDLAKTKPLVEPSSLGVLRPHAQHSKPSDGRRRHDRLHEPPANAPPPVRPEHVQASYSAHALVAAVWVDVKVTDANDYPMHRGDEQRLIRLIEAIGAACPLVGQPADEPPTVLFALGNERGNRTEIASSSVLESNCSQP